MYRYGENESTPVMFIMLAPFAKELLNLRRFRIVTGRDRFIYQHPFWESLRNSAMTRMCLSQRQEIVSSLVRHTHN